MIRLQILSKSLCLYFYLLGIIPNQFCFVVRGNTVLEIFDHFSDGLTKFFFIMGNIFH